MTPSSILRVAVLAISLTPLAGRAAAPTLPYRVVAEFPHDVRHFTQGLEIHDGRLYESAGGYGQSALFVKDLRTGKIGRQQALEARIFGEGLTVLGRQLYVLTWREGVILRFDTGLREQHRYPLPREGWGLTHLRSLAGDRLLMSDGSSTLFWLDPATLSTVGELAVTDGDQPVWRLNELESARGEIYANVWTSARIAVIRPGSGQVRGWLDLASLIDRFEKPPGWLPAEHVLNGIAFDEASGHFFVTGKCWPKLFELDLPN